MKLSCVAPILLAGCVTAFAPSAPHSTSTSLYGVVGDEVREGRSSYAKPINYQRQGGVVGNDGSANVPRAVVVAPYGEVGETVNGHDVRGARSSYAKPTNFHFTTSQIPATEGFGQSLSSVQGNSIRDTVNGHDVRGARSSYAQGANYHFETREIGYDGTPRRQVDASSGPYVQQRVSPEFLPHSSTGAGNHSPARSAATAAQVVQALGSAPAASSGGPPKSFGIGSWKK